MRLFCFAILIAAFASCSNSQERQVLGIIKNDTTAPVMIIFGGESNSGGLAANSYATTGELAAHASVQLFDNENLNQFYSLDIGTNNLIGHAGLQYAKNTAHGWELQLANRVESGNLNRSQIYLVKGGQGGTTAQQWLNGNTYTDEGITVNPFATFVSRVNAAKSLIQTQTGKAPRVFLFWSQGINDCGQSRNVTLWKADEKTILTNIRNSIGNVPVFFTQFQGMSVTGISSYNTAIAEIASEMSEVYAVDNTGAETAQVVAGAGFHWGYTGAKLVSNNLINALLAHYSLE